MQMRLTDGFLMGLQRGPNVNTPGVRQRLTDF